MLVKVLMVVLLSGGIFDAGAKKEFSGTLCLSDASRGHQQQARQMPQMQNGAPLKSSQSGETK